MTTITYLFKQSIQTNSALYLWFTFILLEIKNISVDCVPHTQVSLAWNSDVSYMPLPWPFSFQYISHTRGGCFEANQNATLQKTSRALPALLFGQGLRAIWSCNCCPVDTGSCAPGLHCATPFSPSTSTPTPTFLLSSLIASTCASCSWQRPW